MSEGILGSMHDEEVGIRHGTKELSVTCSLRYEKLVVAFEPLDLSSKCAHARSVLVDDV